MNTTRMMFIAGLILFLFSSPFVHLANSHSDYPSPTPSSQPTSVPTISVCPTRSSTPTPTRPPASVCPSQPPHPTQSPYPTKPPHFTPTPTLPVTVSPTQTPSPTVTPVLTSTPTPISTETLVPTPTETSVPGPTDTPGPGPTNTPSSNNNQNNNPVTSSIVGAGAVSAPVNNTNPIVEGIKAASGQVLGASTLPQTGSADDSPQKLPSSDQLLADSYIFIPKIGVNLPLFAGSRLGSELLVGDKEADFYRQNQSLVVYGHYTSDVFSHLNRLNAADLVALTLNNQTSAYTITSVKWVVAADSSVLSNLAADSLTIISCDKNQPFLRIIVTAVKTNS